MAACHGNTEMSQPGFFTCLYHILCATYCAFQDQTTKILQFPLRLDSSMANCSPVESAALDIMVCQCGEASGTVLGCLTTEL